MSSLRTSLFGRSLYLLVFVLLFSACASTEVKKEDAPPARETKAMPPLLDTAQQELASAVASYENGNYKVATKQFDRALAFGLRMRQDQAKAHKYRAFMHCVGGRKRQCRGEFRTALDLDPTFDLTPAEAGHPTWGPVFRDLKRSHKPASK